MADDSRFTIGARIESFRYAFRGLRTLLVSQHNAWIHLAASVAACVLGFALEINNIEGSLLELDADVIYHPWEHVGFGAGFRYFNANVESKGSRLNGEFDFKYFGPVLYGVIAF